MNFAYRKKQHDDDALPLVRIAFEKQGFSLFPFGGELVPELQKMLRNLSNGTSKMLRYRPDLVAVNLERGSLLVEIKSEQAGSPNFAVEFDAWDAARLWNQQTRRVLYVFVDLLERTVTACWPETLCPQKVYVPRINDVARIKASCPDAVVKHRPAVYGSGTAFFLVPKMSLEAIESVLCAFTKKEK